ncbi:hypothetical protein BZG02_06180 [Labilibaculum filiforme]|uniref:Spore coat protein CotH n=1 Tax=Labilibaculum filiforme TaxID=1940526 RepID=A0A2N3I263_9BACT|nr:CotH kinase family protein [Labilibaculum filiforme]PKQ64399.1 hypothetical protein BZG02_06180 [Labilibaculum filiforme]
MNKILQLLIVLVLYPVIAFPDTISVNKDSIAGGRIFNSDIIHEVRIQFLQCDAWDSLLFIKKERDSLRVKRYLQGNVEVNGKKYFSCGVRIKGESSFDYYPGKKKSLKIKFGEFNKTQKLDGLKTINLNNAFRDPSFMREKLYLDFMREEGLPVPRCTYANVYLNNEHLGLYVLTEEVDRGFLERNFQNKKGAFFKGEPKATFAYHGDDSLVYVGDYRNKNKSVNEYADLMQLIRVINGKEELEGSDSLQINDVFNVESCLKIFAITSLFLNVDAYNLLYPHNFYLYKNTDTKKFEWIPYDGNYALCAFSSVFDLNQAENLSVFYLHDTFDNPLTELLFSKAEYQKLYTDYITYLLSEKFTSKALNREIETLARKIRRSVYYDTHKMYSNAEFETNIHLSIGNTNDAGAFIPGLEPFIEQRIKAVKKELKIKN